MSADQTPLDVEAIRARLDAVGDRPWTTQHNSYGDEWWFGGSSGSGENVIAFGDDDLGVLQGDCSAEAELIAHAPADLRRLLDENARLNTALDEVHELWGAAEQGRERADRQIRVHLDIARAAERERDEVRSEASRLYRSLQQTAKRVEDDRDALAATVEALSARLTAKNTELDKVIREAAADKAKLAALPDLETIRRIERERGNWGLRLGQIRAELSSHLSESTDPCMDHGNEYPCDVKQALDAAPEMPRPPAEEGCTCHLTDPSTWTTYGSAVEPGSMYEPDPDCPEHGAHTEILTAQERAGDTETSSAGSGRGTGVTEASGTAEPSIAWRGEACEHKAEWRCSAHGECRGCECACFTYLPSLPVPSTETCPDYQNEPEGAPNAD